MLAVYFFTACFDHEIVMAMEESTSRENTSITFSRHWFVILTFACFYLVAERGSSGIGLRPGFYITNNGSHSPPVVLDRCSDRYIYMYCLPSKFNGDLLGDYRSLSKWFNMCPFIVNYGLCPRLNKKGWFAAKQFMLEVIFHGKRDHYECLTNDSSLASAVFVPFYVRLNIRRHLWGFNVSMRGSLEKDLVEWLKRAPEWRKTRGADQFLIGGRIWWDFRRRSNDDTEWGGKLMRVPKCRNMTMLTIESISFDNEAAIPYPTYFHPTTLSEVIWWQNKMRHQRRSHLFSFVGGPRNNSIRAKLMVKCQGSGKKCLLLNRHDLAINCDDLFGDLGVHKKSEFSLQPPGDSDARRSTFNSVLAGCIPVVFRRNSAYTQYFWQLPRNCTKYSIFITEDDKKQSNISVAETRLRIPTYLVNAMTEEVIKLIPRIVYADPRHEIEQGLEDAFNVDVKGVLDWIQQIKMELPTNSVTFHFRVW